MQGDGRGKVIGDVSQEMGTFEQYCNLMNEHD